MSFCPELDSLTDITTEDIDLQLQHIITLVAVNHPAIGNGNEHEA